MSGVEVLLLVVMLAFGFLVAFAIGSNDEAMSPAVGSKVLTLRTAVCLGACISLVGALSLGGNVSAKVGSDLIGGRSLTTAMVLAILLAMSLWLLVVSAARGLPISTTQCIVGSVIGAVLIAAVVETGDWGVNAVSWAVVAEILAGWLVSPVIGFLVSAAVITVIRRTQRRVKGLTGVERQEKLASYALVVFLIWTTLSRGGNDVANAVAPLVSVPEFQGTANIGPLVVPAVHIPLLVGGIGMGAGLIVVGRKVIKTLATEVVTLSPTTALSASVSVSLVLFFGTLLGFPLSGTHVLVAALIAVGWVESKPLQRKQVMEIVTSWIITVPLSALLAAGMLVLLCHLFPGL
ncbi:MAG: inorganic phosphate transporter [Candidatus Thorarchaeota archaeon]|nr:inorganic phosphate transporter [Candidatus Thorarchaeota archaeon]